MTGFQREEDRLHFPLLLGALAASWYLSRCAAIDPSASPADHIPWPARLTARSRQRGCADPGVTVVAARAVPGWHSCAVPESGSPAAGGPRRGADAAASRPFGQVAERSFYCRSCRLAARGRWIPAGWYVLERAAGGGGRHLRVGLYCSLGCLAAAAGGGLAEAEQDAGAWHGLPAGAARGRARLVEIAQTLLHQGATIRAAGDELGVPTSALRHWLREAGVRVGADGTLTGSAAPVPPGKDKDGAAHGIAAGPRTPAPAASGSPPAPAAAGGPPPAPAAVSGAPVQALHELAQAGYVTGLDWETEVDGAAHRPVFSCTVSARVTGIPGPARARGTGGSKAAAKASAAAALLARLADDGPAAEDASGGADDAPARKGERPC